MANIVSALDQFHKTKSGYLVFALIELASAYGFASLSIDRGNLWWYLVTLVFLVGFLQNFVHLITAFFIKPKLRQSSK